MRKLRLREGNDLSKATWPVDSWARVVAIFGLSSLFPLLSSSCVLRGSCDYTEDTRETLHPARRCELSLPGARFRASSPWQQSHMPPTQETAVTLAGSSHHPFLPALEDLLVL